MISRIEIRLFTSGDSDKKLVLQHCQVPRHNMNVQCQPTLYTDRLFTSGDSDKKLVLQHCQVPRHNMNVQCQPTLYTDYKGTALVLHIMKK